MLPAVGYSAAQLTSLAATIEAAPVDVVVAATPIDLARLIDLHVPIVLARYDYADAGTPTLVQLVNVFLAAKVDIHTK